MAASKFSIAFGQTISFVEYAVINGRNRMPTKLPRYMLTVDNDLAKRLEADAKREDRMVANLILHIVRKYYESLPPEQPREITRSSLLSIKQASQYLKKSRVTIWRLMHRKSDPLPAVRVGSSPMIPMDKLLWWLEKNSIN